MARDVTKESSGFEQGRILSMSSPFLSLEDVSVRFNGKILLQETRWEIRSDEHWAVIGANGSGKSALTRVLCGDIPVARGRISYHFESTAPWKSIQLVSFDEHHRAFKQKGGFYQARWNSLAEEDSPWVSEALSEESILRINPFEILPRRSDPALFRKRQEAVIERLAIEGLLNKRVVQLSSGETRKLLIARALLRNPRLLILSNPFTGLDAAYRKKLKSTLEGLMNGPMRLIVVTTRREEIPTGITHALVLKGHRVVAQGPVQEILEGGQAKRIWKEESKMPARPLRKPDAAGEHRKKPVLVHMYNVRVRYGEHEILRGIDWTVRSGEHWALMGKNGSGKSTLLSLILGDNPQAYANDIRLFGNRRGTGDSIWEIKRRIGYVSPELHAYFPWRMSCFDVVRSGFFDSIGLYRSCTAQQGRAASEWLERLGVGKHGPEAFQRVSRGEQRLVLLARAFIKRPRLMVLDEPCQGLDPSFRRRFVRAVEEAGHGMFASLIYVTHLPEEIPRIITHRLVLDSGRVIESGLWQGIVRCP